MSSQPAGGRVLADTEPVRLLGTISQKVPSGGTINARDVLVRRSGEIVLAGLTGEVGRQIGPSVTYTEAQQIAADVLAAAGHEGMPEVLFKLALAYQAAWCSCAPLRRAALPEAVS